MISTKKLDFTKSSMLKSDITMQRLFNYWAARRSSLEFTEMNENLPVPKLPNGKIGISFLPGTKLHPLCGNCSMLKFMINDQTLIIYGRTDLECKNTTMITHANWRKDIILPKNLLDSKIKCSQKNGRIIVLLE